MAAPVVLGSAALSSGKVAVLAGNYGLVTQNGASYAVFDALQVAILGIGAQTTLSASQALTFPTNGSPDRRPNPTGGATITALPGGGLAVESWGGADANYYVQILNNTGTVTTAPFVIGTANAGGVADIDPYNPVGAIGAWSGGIVVAWSANDEQLDKFERLSNAGSVVGSVITFATAMDSTNWFGSMAVDPSGNVIFGIASENVSTNASFLEYNSGNTLVATGTLDELANTPYFAALPGGGFITVGYVPTGAYSSGYPGFNLTIQTISATGTVTRVETYANAAGAGYPPVVTELAVSSTGTLVFLEPGHSALDTYVIATGVLTRDALAIPSGVTLTGNLVADAAGDVDSAATTGTHVAVEALLGGVAASGPTITAGAAATFIGGGAAVTLDPTLSVSDAASATLASATIAINGGFVAGDTLAFTNQNGITGSYNSATGTLTLSGSATIANYQSALESISYDFTPTNGDPTDGGGDTGRTISWVVNDGTTNSTAAGSTLHAIHAAPTVTAGGTVGFSAGGTAVAVDAAIAVSDPDSGGTLTGATVAITSGYLTGDTLGFTAQGGITGSYNALTGALTLSGTATVASYRAVLASVTYGSSAVDPTAAGTDGSRTIGFTVTDGVASSGAASSVLDITRAGPVVTAGTIVSFIGGAGPVVLDSGLQVSDGESLTLTGATVAITTGLLLGDQLNFTAQNGITGSYNAATGVLTLNGVATLATYQTALESITYSFTPTNADPTGAGLDTSRTIDWVVNDGTRAGATAVSTVDEVHYAPSVTAGGTVAFAAGGPAILLDGTVTVADPDSSGELTGATIWVASGFITGDALSFTPQDGIIGSYNAATGVLTLAGVATLADYQAALASVSYDFSPSTGDPTAGGTDPARVIDYRVTDGIANSGTASVVVDTAPAAPSIVAGGVAVFVGGGSPVVLDTALAVTDPLGAGTLTGGTVAIGTGFLAGDTLGFTAQGGITGTYNATTGVLTLSGTASVAAYQTALDSVTYSFAPANGDPTGGGGDLARVINWMVTAGTIASATATSVLDTLHSPPIVTAGGTVVFTGGGAAVLADPTLTLADPDSGGVLTGATVAIGSGFLVGGTLGFTAQGGITGGYNATTGVLTLSGTASIAAYQAVLDSVTYGYSPVDADPTGGGTDPGRVIDWTVRDGAASSAVATSAINAVHAAPTVTAGGTVSFAAGGAAVVLDPTLTVADPDSGGNLTGATIAIGTGFTLGDTLGFVPLHNIVGVYNPTTGVLTLAGIGTLANYQAALASITYSFTPATGDPTDGGADLSRTITWTITDGVATSATSTSTLQEVAAGPTVTAGATAVFTGGGTAVALDPALSISDANGSGELIGATVSIGSGFLPGDTLGFTAQSGITGSYNAATGVLTLSGTASVAAYQTALDSVTYDFTPSSGDPTSGGGDTTRMIDWIVSTGTVSSVAATSTLDAVVAAPTITAGGTAAFTGGGPAVVLDATLAVTSPGSILSGATVAIGSGFILGDTLGFVAQNNITGVYNPTLGILTLSGSATAANYQAALDSITYSFTPSSADPTGGTGDTGRVIDWSVSDGVARSVSATSTLTVAPDDGPTLSASGTVVFTAGEPAITLDPDVTPSDTASDGVLTGATVAITGGTFSGDGDVLGAIVRGTAILASYSNLSETLTLVGTDSVAHYQQVLRGVAFESLGANPTDSGSDPTRTITWTVRDGTAVSNSPTSAVTIAAATQAGPTVTAVTASPASGVEGVGQTVTITLTMSTAVLVVGGAPSLTLNDGGSASYNASASSPTALVFTYTVAAGQNTPALSVTGVALNGATITGSGAVAADLSGAVSQLGGALQIDTAGPAAPSTPAVSPASDSGVLGDGVTDITTPTLTGTATPGDTIVLYDGATSVGSAVAGTGGAWSITTTPLGLGVAALSATDTDAAGNVSPASGTLDLTIVAVPSAPGDLVLASSGVSGNDRTPTITGTGTAGDTIILNDGTTPVGSGLVGAGGTWSIVTDSLADGVHPLSATQTDAYGDISAASATLDVVIGASPSGLAPPAPANLALSPASDSGTQGDDITDITTPTITGTGIEDDTVLLYDGTATVGSAVVGSDGTWSITTGTLSLGAATFSATQSDLTGDISAGSTTLDVTIVAVPPVPADLTLDPASDSGTPGDDITNDTTPDITGTGVAGDTITLYDQTLIQPLDAGGTPLGSAVVGADGTWSIVTTSLADGLHALAATQTDGAGDISALSDPLQIEIEATAAAPTIEDEPAQSTSPAQPVVGGQAPDLSTVTIYQDAGAIGTAVAGAAGAWSFAFPTALADGSYSITATATDLAGNVSPQSGTLTVQVDADGGYSTVAPPDTAGDVISTYFDSDGAVSTIDTSNSAGKVLQSVSNTQALLNIYDGFGNLIGTVTQPSSSALSTPGFTTQGQGDTAVTSTGPDGTMINLLAEQNVVYSQGDDTISAGAGADTIMASGASTSVTGGSGSLVLLASSGSASTVSGGSGSSTVFGGDGGSIQGGSAGKNLLVATGGATTLVGGGNGDTEVAAGGTSTLVLQPDGTAFGGSGTTTIFGAGHDTMVGGSGNTVMVGNSASGNAMFAAGGNTTMFGSTGNDTMVGGSGQTVMVLQGGNDLVAGGSGGVTVFGGSGSDSYFATGGGTMHIVEGSGRNQVVLGTGATDVTGGSGVDSYDVTNGTAGGADVIQGFKVGIDQLNLFGYPAADAQPQFSGGNAVFVLSDGTRITLVGVSSLAANSVG